VSGKKVYSISNFGKFKRIFIIFVKSGHWGSFLRATAGTAIARLSHRNSVHPFVCHTGGSGKNGAS